MNSTGTDVRNQVEAMRQKLLDLSLRNRMLNYRHSKRLGLAIVGEDSAEVVRLLAEEGKRMSFVGRPDPPATPPLDAAHSQADNVAMSEYRRAAEEEIDAFIGNAAMPVNQMDTKLNVDELESLVQAKLRTILREAHLAQEELGVNTLFLALGMLEWRETDARSYRAPLLFLPVKLVKQANGTTRLEHDGSDLGSNLPLKAKLAEFNLALPELNDDLTVRDYFEQVESTIRSRNDWTVHRDEIALAFFNYEKYAMYLDLGGESWPENRKPWMDEDVVAMLGSGFEPVDSPLTENSYLDQVRPVQECHEVYDADSSQTLAMIRAADGISMVVEGPPGTGKSQTITNIIAEAVAAGKTVLFVSAKRAALEVVKRRLTEAGLGAMCLDLHDKLTNRREFYGEIKRTANLSVTLKSEEEKVARLTELRENLNAHSAAMNEEVAPFGITPFQAMSELARLPAENPAERDGRISFEALDQWSETDIRTRLPLVRAIEQRLKGMGVPKDHPFWGAEIDYVDPGKRLDLIQDVREAIQAVEQAIQSFDAARQALRIELPGAEEQVETLRRTAQAIITAPAYEGLALRADWVAAEPKIRETIQLLRRRQELRSTLQPSVRSDAWTRDWTTEANAYNLHAHKWHRFVSGDFRTAQRNITPNLIAQVPPTIVRDLLGALVELRTVEREIESLAPVMASSFGRQWQGLETDPGQLESLLAWILDIHAKVRSRQLPEGILTFLEQPDKSAELQSRVDQAAKDTRSAIAAYRRVAATLEFDTTAVQAEMLDALRDRLIGWRDGIDRLPEFISYNEVRRKAIENGLQPVVDLADRWPLASDLLATTFLRSYYTGVLRQAMQNRPALKVFERTTHEGAIEEFQALDDFKLKYNRAQVRVAHQRRLPSFADAAGNLLQLRLQCELQRRHKPIRWIMGKAGEAIQRIKPVFMMSPLSVAIHLPPELPQFDVVIFDEASQVKPEDALSAVIRARQTIVVGDTRQMPPTSFFDRVADDLDDDEPAEEGMELGVEARKLESILSMMSAVTMGSARRPDLRWHYRSLHPSLIQPSNEMFYENRLVVFPSPSTSQQGRRVGVVFHHHPETTYEPGSRKRFNPQEAQIVAQAVLKHLRQHPRESLMVAAMNKSQADLIYDEVQKLERLHPDLFALYRTHHPHEPLEVKNLENVQGDERDVVFISVTYGRDQARVIRQQFGPLLLDGGERRLNVLITRARIRCEVFSNLSADDIRADSHQGGVYNLKRYLSFAQGGNLGVAVGTGEEAGSPFEEEVAEALNQLGYEVDIQVGSEGYRIDMAVRDPAVPGRYILGIECDGATYHSARSARDRDKLRQRVLESRGWKLHRIWSHDWWQERENELKRLVAAIEKAKSETPEEPEPTNDENDAPQLIEQELASNPAVERTRPYIAAPVSYLATDEELSRYLVQVVEAEQPIHHELLIIRLRDASGVGRASRAIKDRLEQFIDAALRSNQIARTGDAYCISDPLRLLPRDWSDRPASERKISLVPQAEIFTALLSTVKHSFGITRPEACKRTLALLGFKRATQDAMDRMQSVLMEAIKVGSIEERADQLAIP